MTIRRLHLDLTPNRLAAVDALAKRYQVARSDILQQALEHYIAEQRKVYALDQAVREALPL